MDEVIRLELMLHSLNISLKVANKSGDLEYIRRVHVARTAVLLSLVDVQKRFILNRRSS